MISVSFGGCVYGPGVFMFEEEAAIVKQELIMRGTQKSLKLAGEIGIPSGGTVHCGEKRVVDVSSQGGRS